MIDPFSVWTLTGQLQRWPWATVARRPFSQGQGLGGSKESVPVDRWVYLALSSQPWLPASPRAFLLPHGLKLSVFDVRELRRAQTALHTVSCSPKPFLLHPQTEAGHRGSLDLYLVAGELEPVEERLRERRETDSRGW